MKHIFANWKMYLNFDETMILTNQLLAENFDTEKINLAVFPNALATSEVLKATQDSSISVGAQTANWTPRGAYTGAISADFYSSLGCQYALVGHSERRYIFGETYEDVRKKLEAIIDAKLTPVLCIGDTKGDQDDGKAEYRLKKQLMKALENLELDGSELIIAYEPVWAIGSGEPCMPEDANKMANIIKMETKQYIDKEISILYGGSVKAENVLSYLSQDNISGVLVGGASAKFETLMPIIREIENIS